MSQKIRVLVIDDSALMRKLIPQLLLREDSIEVVGTAMDGSFGLKKIEELHPHVVTLDLEMPRMDGMETLRQIMRSLKVPVIIVSAHSTAGASATFKALAYGAFDFVAKPQDPAASGIEKMATELIAKIKVAARAGTSPLRQIPLAEFKPRAKRELKTRPVAGKVVAIGISTGGPNALQYLLPQLPADFPAAILIVQHMPEGFTSAFARRLDETCAIEVKEAQSGDLLLAGRALLAPGNRHMKVRHMPMGHTVVLSDEPFVNGHRPSVDVLFRSVAHEFGNNAIALIMTGMGDDGADAMRAVVSAGGMTIAQDEESCVVFGMPKAAIDKKNVLRVVPLDALANTLQAQCSQLHAVAAKG